MRIVPLVTPRKLDSLGRIRDYVRQASASAGLSEDAEYRLLLGVDEIATNTVTHGPEDSPESGTITISAEITPSELIVAVEDRAPRFDPRAHSMPTPEDLAKPAAEREIGGLGIFLAVTGVDRFDYEWVRDHNRNILAMKRSDRKETA